MSLEDISHQCPACECTSLNTDTDLADGICADCGLVYDDGSWPEQNVAELTVNSPNEKQAEPESNWRNEITIYDASDQQLVRILSYIDYLTAELSLSDEEHTRLVDLAVETWNTNLMHGRSLESVLAGVVCVTCRESGQPRPSHFIATVTETTSSKIQNMARILIRELDLQIRPPRPRDYVPYLSKRLELSEHVKQDVLKLLSENAPIGGNPAAVAAAACYTEIDCSTSLTLGDAGDLVGVTKETVWRHTTHFD